MSQFEKAVERIKSKPTDYTYDEAKQLLRKLGFEEYNKGKTSGSRVQFYRAIDKSIILLHKPHPHNYLTPGAVTDLERKLKEMGEIR